MSTVNNLSTLNISTDTTNSFFNNFFQPSFTVSQGTDDATLSFFEKISNNRESAKLMASSVIYTSLAANIDPIETLAKFSTMATEELNSYVVMFLNLNRVGTSYLGINNAPRVSKYVKRMIMP